MYSETMQDQKNDTGIAHQPSPEIRDRLVVNGKGLLTALQTNDKERALDLANMLFMDSAKSALMLGTRGTSELPAPGCFPDPDFLPALGSFVSAIETGSMLQVRLIELIGHWGGSNDIQTLASLLPPNGDDSDLQARQRHLILAALHLIGGKDAMKMLNVPMVDPTLENWRKYYRDELLENLMVYRDFE